MHMDTGVYSVAMPVCKANKGTQTLQTLQGEALCVLARQGDPLLHTPSGIAQMVGHRQSKLYRLRFARVLGTLRCRALIHICTGPRSPKYVGLESEEELLPHLEEHWTSYTIAYEPCHWYVSDWGNACIRVNLN